MLGGAVRAPSLWPARHPRPRQRRLPRASVPPPLRPSRGTDAAPEAGSPVPTGPAPEDMPRGDIEERVAALWRERLGLEFVGRDDDFLELGGNSLMAAQLLNQLRDTFGVNLPLAALFDSPHRRGHRRPHRGPAAVQAPQAAAVTTELPLVPLPRDGELPLSYVQERVWRLEQYLPGPVRLQHPLRPPAGGRPGRGRCWSAASRRSSSATRRCAPPMTPWTAAPCSASTPRMHVPLTCVVLDGPPEEREAEALRLAREDAARPSIW